MREVRRAEVRFQHDCRASRGRPSRRASRCSPLEERHAASPIRQRAPLRDLRMCQPAPSKQDRVIDGATGLIGPCQKLPPSQPGIAVARGHLQKAGRRSRAASSTAATASPARSRPLALPRRGSEGERRAGHPFGARGCPREAQPQRPAERGRRPPTDRAHARQVGRILTPSRRCKSGAPAPRDLKSREPTP